MDSVTQITLGAAVGEAVLGKKVGNKAPLWGGLLGTLPDLDVLANPFVSEMQALALHRGLTHSLLFTVLMTPLLGWLLSRLHRRDGASFQAWSLLVLGVLSTHILLDCFTNYGTQVFYPFSTYPVIFGTIFIIDPLYTVPLGIGLIAALRLPPTARRRRLFNYVGLGLSTLYLLLTAVNKLHMESVFTQALTQQGHTVERTFVQPTAFNNLLWTCIAEDESGFWIGYHSLLDGTRPIDFRRVEKNHDLLGDARDAPAVQRLAWFSRGYYTVSRSNGALYVHDLRFGRTDLGLTDRGQYIFTFRLTEGPNGHITGFRPLNPQLRVNKRLLQQFIARVWGYETMSVDPVTT